MCSATNGRSNGGTPDDVHLPTHALVNLTALEHWTPPESRSAVLLGALMPDLPVLIFYFVCRFGLGFSDERIWQDIYYRDQWFNLFASFHSIPLTGTLLALGVGIGSHTLALFGASMLLHNLADLPLHAKDAHRHFYPLSNYRFKSPISYWNPTHWGRVTAAFESLLLLGCSAYMYPLLVNGWSKIALVVVNVAFVGGYLAVYWGRYGDHLFKSMSPE